MKKLFTPVLAGLILVAVQFVLLETPFYAVAPWFDMAMHILAGLVAGWFFLLLRARVVRSASRFGALLFVVGGVALFGVFWEFFEWAVENYAHIPFQGDLNDTLSDLAMDLLGGTAAALASRIKK